MPVSACYHQIREKEQNNFISSPKSHLAYCKIYGFGVKNTKTKLDFLICFSFFTQSFGRLGRIA